jgi:thiamine pyrophosphokinase
MRVIIVTYPTPHDIKMTCPLQEDDYIIGVDAAISTMYKQRVPIHLAVGDFDSLKNHGLLHNLEKAQLPVRKDVTDTFYALQIAYSKKPDEVILVGGKDGDRIEHMYAHFLLFNHFPSLKMLTDESIIKRYDGSFNVTHQGFINLFGYPKATVSLEGFEYPLHHKELSQFEMLGISNELKEKEGHVIIHDGTLLVIMTNKKGH